MHPASAVLYTVIDMEFVTKHASLLKGGSVFEITCINASILLDAYNTANRKHVKDHLIHCMPHAATGCLLSGDG